MLTSATPSRLPDTMHCYIPARYVLAFLGLLGFANVFMLRVNLSVAIVQMQGDFKWTPDMKGVVLSSFFYGYLLTNVPGSLLARKFGGKLVFGLGCLCTSVMTLFTPLAAYRSGWVLVGLRVVEGLGEGVTYPAMHVILSRWAPPLERSKLVTFMYSGALLGTVFAMPISGLLCDHGFASPPKGAKWSSVFYVFGGLGLIWCLAWFLLIHDSPAQHPRISSRERSYIETSLHDENRKEATRLAEKSTSLETGFPVWPIFTSPPVWAITINAFCGLFGFYSLLTCLPSYMKDVLGFDITENGLLSALPYALMGVVAVFSGWLADVLRKNEIMSTVTARKFFQTIGLSSAGFFPILATFTASKTIAVVYLCLGVGLGGLSMAGASVNHLDLAPKYAGFLLGIGNTAGTAAGILSPYLTSAMTPAHPGSQALKLEWRNVFYLCAEINMFGVLIYLILASGRLQWWANGVTKKGVQEIEDRKQLLPGEETINTQE
eukprot:m.29645 g.29645  ORF g.29645 m.29645 type:complete len:491 (+) comp31204_c0_seq3:156-1628(+)